MTTKRNRGFTSLDLVLPIASHYRTDPQLVKDVETMRTNAASRWAKDDYSNTLAGYHNTGDNLSKIATLARPKIEILRANSPTFKRLLAVRVKLEKYFNTIARSISASRQSTRSVRETPYPTVYEKQSSALTRPANLPPPLPSQQAAPPPPAAPATKPIKPQSSLDNGPLDKITYEKTWTRSGDMKQKCSLEIWLPKPSLDDDGNTTRTASPDTSTNEKQIQPIAPIKSRRSSVVKITATSMVTNIETKSIDETSSKKSEPIVIPHVYHYGDYIMDLPEERPRSSKSITTVKSDGAGSNKSGSRRQYTRPHTRRQSISTNPSEEILRFGTTEVPTSAKNLSIDTKSTSPNREVKITVKPSNSCMINELIQKYSLIKKSHEELTQAKLQIEKPHNDLKNHSARSRPPPIPESTSIVLPDQPTLSVRKLLIDTASTRSATDHSSTNTKLLDRRSTPRKPSHSDIYPQLRIFSLANQQQRQSSASVPTAAALPTVVGKKNDDTLRMLQRSKTLNVVLDVPNSTAYPSKVSSRLRVQSDSPSHNLYQRAANETVFIEQAPSSLSKRSKLTHHTEQQHKIDSPVLQTAAQRYHNSTTIGVPTNKVLVHFNYSTSGNRLVPE